MSDLASFLAWFEGFAENIEGAPSERQWNRIKERIGTLTGSPAKAITQAAPQAPAPPPPPPKPKNDDEWLTQYRDALISLGLDADSAREFTADVNGQFTLSDNPLAIAKQNMGPILNN